MRIHSRAFIAGANRTGSFICKQCKAVVALTACPVLGRIAFEFRIALVGAGVDHHRRLPKAHK